MGCTTSDMRHEGNEQRYMMREIMSTLRQNIVEVDTEKKVVAALNKTSNVHSL